MKTNTRFTATVRLLVGGQLNVHMASPNVSVSIISENQVRGVVHELLGLSGQLNVHMASPNVSVSIISENQVRGSGWWFMNS